MKDGFYLIRICIMLTTLVSAFLLIQHRYFRLLPEIDGYELMDYTRPTGIPVIFIMVKGALQDCVKGLKLAQLFLTQPIKSLTKGAMCITRDDYNKRFSASGSDEIGELSKSFNMMADAIEEKIDKLSVNAQQQ